MVSFVVFDRWLPHSLLEAVHELTHLHRGEPTEEGAPRFSWYSPAERRHVSRLSLAHLEVAQAYVENLMARVGPLLDCKPAGYEWWTNEDNTLPWHVDRDETLFRTRGETRHPLWSTVLYTRVDVRGQGGDLVMQADESQPAPYDANLLGSEVPHRLNRIAPVTNRLIVFRRGTRHRIDPFEGHRSSLAMNVWDATPLEFERYGEDSRFQHALG